MATDNTNLLTSKYDKPQARTRKRTVEIPEGKFAVIRDKGYNQKMYDAIMAKDWELATVREREVITINGVRFYVEGPEQGEDSIEVLLPRPLASVLRHSAESMRSAKREWRERTAKALGGSMPDEVR